VCQPCTIPLNASRIVVANGRTPTPGNNGKNKNALVVGLSAAGAGVAVLAAVGAAFYLVVFRKWDKKAHVTVRLGESSSRGLCRDAESMVMPAPERSALQPARPLGCEEFTLKDLSRLTNGFAEESKIGSGSFGCVYRAKLADGREIAIKRAERASTGARRRRRFDAEHAFRSELRLLCRVNHRNLVSLLGFCEERGERILVFEFMPHGALHDHLHGDATDRTTSPLFLSWEARLRVALDAARGVEYLHCYAVPLIIHRDIKPSNILLDADWTAKVSDFGLSLASGSASAPNSKTSGTAGTVGYMDPEYYRLQELTERSDVYSFGVVLLELVTGRKAIHRDNSEEGSGSPRNVIEFAVPAVEAGDISTILDGRVPAPRGHEVEAVARVAKIGAECVRRGRGRPVMSEVVAELEWAVTLCEEYVGRTTSGARNSSSRHGGSDMSRSRSRSESEDRSPYHTREFSFDSGRVAGVGHGRSYSTM
jgi:serine/threonine protein kinase